MSKRIAVVVGLAFFWPLFRSSYFGFFFSSTTGISLPSIILSITMMGCAVLAATQPRLVDRLFESAPYSVIVLSLATTIALLLCSEGSPWPLISYFAAILSGIATSLLALAWAAFCLTAGKAIHENLPIDGMFSLFVSFVITSFNVFAPQLASLVYPLFPIASALVWTWGRSKDGVRRGKSSSAATPLVALLVIGLFISFASIIVGIYSTSVSNFTASQDYDRYILSLALSLALAVAMGIMHHHRMPTVVLWGLLFLIVFVGLFLLLLNDQWMNLGSFVIIFGRLLMWVLFWIMLVSMAIEKRANMCVLVGLFFLGFKSISSLITDFCAIPIAKETLGAGAGSTIFIVLLVLLICSFVFMGLWGITKGRPDATATISTILGREDNFDRSRICARIADEYKLTEREGAVLVLFSQGYTVKKAAETLIISENTVRTHAKSLYRKLDCHTKQELIDFVNRGIQP